MSENNDDNYKLLTEDTRKKVIVYDPDYAGWNFPNNIDDLDICTIAPSIDNCHSINERVSISSTKRVYDWLKETLIEYNKIK